MTIDITTATAPAAMYVHETMTEEAFDALSNEWDAVAFGDELYSQVEYMNAPQGLILLAHHDDIVGQVDGIHPAALSDSIDRPVNIIEPLAAFDGKLFTRNPVAYNSHWMTRRSQGGLVLAGFGRMIDGGALEAPCIEASDNEAFSMTIYDAPDGPIIGVFDLGAEVVHVIRPLAKEEV